MKIKNSLILKYIKILTFVLALSFSSNSNASATNSDLLISGTNISDLKMTTFNLYALSWSSNWEAFLAWLKGDRVAPSKPKKSKKPSKPKKSKKPSKPSKPKKPSKPSKPKKPGRSQSIPLDGGLGILVLGAAAFGIRKLRGNKEK